MSDNEITVSLTLRGSDRDLMLMFDKLKARDNGTGVTTKLVVTDNSRLTPYLKRRTRSFTSVEAYLIEPAFLNTVDRPEIVGRVVLRLQRGGINTVADLLNCTPDDLLAIYDFGPSALDFVLARLAMDGLKLKSK